MTETLIQNRKRAKQLIDFTGLKFGNIYPTDIDGVIEYKNKAIALFELKHGDAELPEGQRLALRRMIDDSRAAGKEAVLFICEHYVDDCNKDIDASETIVRKFYYNGEWYDGQGYSLKKKLNSFIKYVDKLPF